MSTGRTGTINQALGIALIVFVMLTFILTVTTYLFFGQKLEAEKQVAASAKELDEAKLKEGEEATRVKELAELIGLDASKSVDDMRQEIVGMFPDYKEQDAESLKVIDLAKWLEAARLSKDADLKAAQTAKAAADAARAKSEQNLDAAIRASEEKVSRAEDDVKKVRQDAEKRRLEFEQAEQKLVAEKQQALERSEATKVIIDEIVKGESVLGKSAFEGKDPVTQIGLLIRAIRDRDKTIQLLERTELLAAAAAKDPQAQMQVLEALGATGSEIQSLKPIVKRVPPQPADSGAIDGRIVAVDQRDQAVTIRCESTFGIRPGLVFNVHPGSLPLGSARSVKAVVEVIDVEGRSLVRGRIRRDSIEDPIVPGDTVSTPLWSAGRPLEAVVVGFVDFNGDGKEDPTSLEDLVRRSGGTIERSVGSATTVVIDAGKPEGRGSENRGGLKPAEERRRSLELAEARRLGIRILTLDAFLEWLGADRPVVSSSVTVPGAERIPSTVPSGSR